MLGHKIRKVQKEVSILASRTAGSGRLATSEICVLTGIVLLPDMNDMYTWYELCCRKFVSARCNGR